MVPLNGSSSRYDKHKAQNSDLALSPEMAGSKPGLDHGGHYATNSNVQDEYKPPISRQIKRNAEHGDVSFGQVARVAPPHKTNDTAVGVFIGNTAKAISEHGLISR